MSLDLDFDDAQRAIADAVARFCSEQCTDDVVTATAGAVPADLWMGLAELGILGLVTAEGEGGAVELVAAMEAFGRAVFPGPLAATFFAYNGWVAKQAHIREQAMDRALTAAMSGDLAEATEQITQAKTHGATTAWVLMLAGQVDLFRGKTEDAVENLEAAVEQDPDSVAAQSMLAYAYLMDGKYTEYTKRVATLDSLSPTTPEDYLFQGRAIGLFSPKQGIASMNKAIEQRPSSHLARVMRAWLRVFQALDQENEGIVLRALEELRATRIYLGDNLLLSGTTLYAQLAAVTLFMLAPVIIETVTGPFLDPIADATEKWHGGSEMKAVDIGMWKGIVVGVRASAQILAVQLMILIPCLLLSLFGIGAILAIVISAWFNALIWFDIPCGRRGYGLRDRVALIRRNWARSIGFGLAFQVGMLIPIFNFLLLTPAAAVATSAREGC